MAARVARVLRAGPVRVAPRVAAPTLQTPEGHMNTSIRLQKLNHVAWRCIDAEQTRHFYEDILGLPLAHVVTEDHVPSTGEYRMFT